MSELLNVAEGMEYAADSVEFYLETLDIYIEESDKNNGLMTDYLAAGDMPNYATLVHGLKSTSRMVGALPLGDMAYDLEMKSKEGDLEYVKANHDALLDLYNRTKEEINAYIASQN